MIKTQTWLKLDSKMDVKMLQALKRQTMPGGIFGLSWIFDQTEQIPIRKSHSQQDYIYINYRYIGIYAYSLDCECMSVSLIVPTVTGKRETMNK